MLFRMQKITISRKLLLLATLATISSSIILIIIKQTDTAKNVNNITPNDTSYLKSIEQNQTMKSLPQAIIIGSRKCGTRALLKFLQLNPAIKAAKREIHFFDKPQNYRLGLEWYQSQMPAIPINVNLTMQKSLTIEKSPAYFVTSGVPDKIRAMNSSIKLILIFRDPVTRLISDFSQLVANKVDSLAKSKQQQSSPMEEFYDGSDYANNVVSNLILTTHIDEITINKTQEEQIWINAEKSFEDYVRREDGGIDGQRRAIRIGMYSNYLEKWRSLFNENQFYFVDGEILISNPFEELRKLEKFLGLDPVIKQEDFVFNRNKGFYCVRNNTFPSVSNSILLEDEVKDEWKIICLSDSKGRRHVSVKDNLIQELRKFYAPYNEYLYALTGRNFNWTTG